MSAYLGNDRDKQELEALIREFPFEVIDYEINDDDSAFETFTRTFESALRRMRRSSFAKITRLTDNVILAQNYQEWSD